ncbi:G5 and 3D domain-containing protein [Bacillus sp. JCM 19034]|uniref:G5 and 3D domain-containing protein n=1 Tax=Bacillus sp. JCM 19034 TaxID=1481928 RepID=UPI000785F485|nr:G5 and 3D domain-containing protein [Bacillus sp. JCM 19034]
MDLNRIKFLPKKLLGKKTIISSVCLVLFVSLITYAVYETTKASVTVLIDGEETVVETHANTVADLFEEYEWKVQSYDYIEPSVDTEIENGMTVSWEQAKQVFTMIDGQEETVWTTSKTVEELITELEIEYKEHDVVEPELSATIEEHMELIYESSFLVELISDGEQQEIWTTSTTVADFLEREELELNELDRVEPDLEERLEEETSIQVVRVEKVTDVVEETIDFATVTRKDDDLLAGKEEVVQSGEKGKIEKHYEVILEDGEEVSRELVKEETVKESSDRIVAVGTKEPAPTTSRGHDPVQTSNNSSNSSSSNESSSSASGGTTMTVQSTAYTANCSGCSGVTATGINLNENRNMKVIAVDPNVIPLGSKVHVEGYGTAIAGDTGGAIVGNKIDVHMPTTADAKNWGNRTVEITILD